MLDDDKLLRRSATHFANLEVGDEKGWRARRRARARGEEAAEEEARGRGWERGINQKLGK